MITTKTALVISITKIKKELDNLRSILDESDAEESKNIFTFLVKDIGVLINHFEIDETDEFEMIFLAGLFVEISNIIGIDTVDGVKLTSNWSKLPSQEKQSILDSLKQMSNKSDYFHSIQYIKEIKSNSTLLIEGFIKKVANFLINSDREITEFEKIKNKELNEMFKNDKNAVVNNNTSIISEYFTTNAIKFSNEGVLLQNHNDLKKILIQNQDTLINFDDDVIKKSLQCISFISSLEKDIRLSESRLNNLTSKELIDVWLEIISSQIRSYNYLFLIISQQIQSALINNYVNYYETNNILEKMGVFITKSEQTTHDLLSEINSNQNSMNDHLNLITNQLSSLDSNLHKLNDGVVNLTKSVVSVENSIQNGFNQVSNSLNGLSNAVSFEMSALNEKLESVGSAINYNNLITTVNAYQNHRTNKKLLSLLN